MHRFTWKIRIHKHTYTYTKYRHFSYLSFYLGSFSSHVTRPSGSTTSTLCLEESSTGCLRYALLFIYICFYTYTHIHTYIYMHAHIHFVRCVFGRGIDGLLTVCLTLHIYMFLYIHTHTHIYLHARTHSLCTLCFWKRHRRGAYDMSYSSLFIYIYICHICMYIYHVRCVYVVFGRGFDGLPTLCLVF